MGLCWLSLTFSGLVGRVWEQYYSWVFLSTILDLPVFVRTVRELAIHVFSGLALLGWEGFTPFTIMFPRSCSILPAGTSAGFGHQQHSNVNPCSWYCPKGNAVWSSFLQSCWACSCGSMVNLFQKHKILSSLSLFHLCHLLAGWLFFFLYSSWSPIKCRSLRLQKQLHMPWVNSFKSGSRVWASAKILDQLLYQN